MPAKTHIKARATLSYSLLWMLLFMQFIIAVPVKTQLQREQPPLQSTSTLQIGCIVSAAQWGGLHNI